MKFLTKNKRGDIPITILVLGILAVLGLTIFSFQLSDSVIKEDLDNTDLVERAVVLKERMDLYENVGLSHDKIQELFDLRSDGIGDYIFLSQDKIEIKYYLP